MLEESQNGENAIGGWKIWVWVWSRGSRIINSKLTVIVVSHEVGLVYEEVVVPVELPELAVDYVKVLVAEVGGHLVDVLLVLQNSDDREQVAPPELRHGYLAAPAPIHAVEYPGYYLQQRKKTSIKRASPSAFFLSFFFRRPPPPPPFSVRKFLSLHFRDA